MQKILFIELGFKNFMLMFMDVLFLYYLLKRESVAEKILDIKDKMLGKVATVGLGLVLLLVFIKFTLPCIMDIPYLIQNEYSVVEGISQSNSKKSSRATETREVAILTEEQEEIRISIAGGAGNISEGDWLKVMYLPNSYYGCVVEYEKTVN